MPPHNAGKSALISITSTRKSPWGRSRTAWERKPQITATCNPSVGSVHTVKVVRVLKVQTRMNQSLQPTRVCAPTRCLCNRRGSDQSRSPHHTQVRLVPAIQIQIRIQMETAPISRKRKKVKTGPPRSSPKAVGEVWQSVATRKTRQQQATIKPTKSLLGQLPGAQQISKRMFYVGGISPECSSEDFRSFCEKHCQVIQWHVMSSSRYGTVSARLVVPAEDGPKIEAVWWPDHVFAQPWRFTMSSSPTGTVSSPIIGEAFESPAAAEPEISQ